MNVNCRSAASTFSFTASEASTKTFVNDLKFMDNLKRMKESIFVPVILSREEIQSMLDNADNIKIKAIIALMYSAGLRLTECSLLKIHDFDKHCILIYYTDDYDGFFLSFDFSSGFCPFSWRIYNKKRLKPGTV